MCPHERVPEGGDELHFRDSGAVQRDGSLRHQDHKVQWPYTKVSDQKRIKNWPEKQGGLKDPLHGSKSEPAKSPLPGLVKPLTLSKSKLPPKPSKGKGPASKSAKSLPLLPSYLSQEGWEESIMAEMIIEKERPTGRIAPFLVKAAPKNLPGQKRKRAPEPESKQA
jgi:hypothetical protein